jgi:hypothetical protein
MPRLLHFLKADFENRRVHEECLLGSRRRRRRWRSKINFTWFFSESTAANPEFWKFSFF